MEQKFIAATCPSCGANLQVPDTRERLQCTYCGRTIVVAQPPDLSAPSKAGNYEQLADAALRASNYVEAFEYATRVLEFNPTNAVAWNIKAEAAGWLSNLDYLRIPEMIAGLENAAKYTADAERPTFRQQACGALYRVCEGWYAAACHHFAQFVAWDNEWNNHLARCGVLVHGLEHAHSLDSENKTVLAKLIEVLAENISGRTFVDENGRRGTWFLLPDAEAAYRAKLTDYAAKLSKLDANYKPPVVKSAFPQSSCFVATAAFGSPRHPAVEILRRWRETHLAASRGGRRLIQLYELVGPFLARPLRSSAVLRSVTRSLIVVPAARLAATFLAARDR